MTHKDIDQYMVYNHFSSNQLSHKLEIAESYICMLRSGLRRPSPDLAQKIETETGIPFKSGKKIQIGEELFAQPQAIKDSRKAELVEAA
jgi:hypothetical protein